ncbi:MAG: hypothetical protein ACI4SP_03450, partial [Eubacteriales bacterium]
MELLKHKTLSDYLASDATVLCEKCKEEVSERRLAAEYFICPKCGKYNRVPARVRVEYLVDAASFRELNEKVVGGNPIDFPDYEEKVESSRKKSGEYEGVITGTATIGGFKTCL